MRREITLYTHRCTGFNSERNLFIVPANPNICRFSSSPEIIAENCRIHVPTEYSCLLEIPGKARIWTCVYKAERMKKRTTRMISKHVSNIYSKHSLMFFISPLHEERFKIGS